jgi:hypothetical protein
MRDHTSFSEAVEGSRFTYAVSDEPIAAARRYRLAPVKDEPMLFDPRMFTPRPTFFQRLRQRLADWLGAPNA